MVGPTGPARRLPWLAFLAFALPGVGLAWLALDSLLPTLAAIRAHATAVAFSPRDMLGLPLAVSFLALSAVTLLPYSPPGPRRARATAKHSGRAATVCMVIAAAGALATPVAPIVSRLLVEAAVDPSYRACPPGDRHTSMRWTLPPARCP